MSPVAAQPVDSLIGQRPLHIAATRGHAHGAANLNGWWLGQLAATLPTLVMQLLAEFIRRNGKRPPTVAGGGRGPGFRPTRSDWPCLDRKSTRLNSSHRCISYA